MTEAGPEPPTPETGPPGARIVAIVFGAGFAAIGVVVLTMQWSGSGGFRPPPIPFRIIGSIIALMFVAVGLFAATRAGRRVRPPRLPTDTFRPAGGGHTCPHCGASLAGEIDVSPHGDVKCPYCDSWYNVHGRG